MQLSILIPTHNRPVLFQRCLNAILSQIDNTVEIIVNNDSNDIVEIDHPMVTYYYNKYDNLSDVYKFLLNKATGEFVYYSEDDDYVAPDIVKYWSTLYTDYDLFVGNFLPTYTSLTENKSFWKKTKMFANNSEYVLNDELLQLSQYVFRKSLIDDFVFPNDSNINNDILLVKHALTKQPRIKTSSKIFYLQTTDGGDNISF